MGTLGLFATGQTVVTADLVHVVLGLRVGGDPPVLCDGALPRVVSSQDKTLVGKKGLQVFQVANTALNVLLRIEGIPDAILARCGRDQLHEAFGAFGRNGIGIVVAFRPNDGVN